MTGRRRPLLAFGLLALCIFPTSSVHASETVIYSYDVQGRLVKVSRSGTVNNGVSTEYLLDSADNRVAVNSYTGTAAPTFLISSASTMEGADLSFTVTRTGPTTASANVSYATAGSTATSGVDYAGSSGTLSFAAGQASRTVSISSLEDSALEGNESFLLNLSNASAGTTISDSQGLGLIIDDDIPAFSIGDVTALEGSNLGFVITKTGTTSAAINLSYSTADGTAIAGSDYTAASGTVTFAASESSKTIWIDSIDNGTDENSRTLFVSISGATAGSITDGQGVGTISDNDAVMFSVGDATVIEGSAAVFTVSKYGSTTNSYNVNYGTANGSAQAGSDYTANSGTLTFAPTETSKTVSVSTTDDSGTEDAETLYLNLSDASGGAILSDAQGVGTIQDNEAAAPSFSVSNASVTEGGYLVFTVTKTGSSSTGSFSVNYGTAPGTAFAGADYYTASGTLTFASGETTKTVSILTKDDAEESEWNETMYLNLSGASGGASISDAQGVGTISDNEVCTACR